MERRCNWARQLATKQFCQFLNEKSVDAGVEDDFDKILEKVLQITTYKKAAEIAGCSEGMITFWKRTRVSSGLSETENKIIDASAEFLNLRIRTSETRKAFARRVLEKAVQIIPKYQIAQISNTSLEAVKLLFQKRKLISPTKSDWKHYENVQKARERLIERQRARRIDRELVRLLIHATKSAHRTAKILACSYRTISKIR